MNATVPTSDLAPLQPRLGTLFVLRLTLSAAVVAAAALVPRSIGVSLPRVAFVVAGYLVVSLLVEIVRQCRDGLPLRVIGVSLLVDGVFLAAVITLAGGPTSRISFLLYVHLIAVTLLASYRTGLKIAVWHSLLLVVAHHLQPAITGPDRLSLETAVFAVVAFLAVAVATALCSSQNERELRRSRSGFRALAEMARAMDDVHEPAEVVELLLRAVPAYFGRCRVALYLHAERTVSSLVGGDLVAQPLPRPADQGVIAGCWEAREPLLLRRLDPSTDWALASQMPGARNIVVLPFMADGETNGALVVERGGPLGSGLAASTVGMLNQFSSHAALAYRNVRLMAEVKHLATVDGLTGLANRRTFESALHREVARARRTGEELSLLLVDIDHFKQVNDNHGHPTGDEVLRHVGRVLAGCGREVDLPARYGGEEFAVLLPACAPAEAAHVAERLRSAIAGGDVPVAVTASVGLAGMGAHAADAESLVKAADAALYAAKHSGRDRTVVAEARLRPADAA